MKGTCAQSWPRQNPRQPCGVAAKESCAIQTSIPKEENPFIHILQQNKSWTCEYTHLRPGETIWGQCKRISNIDSRWPIRSCLIGVLALRDCKKTSMQTACFNKENQTRACSEFHRSRSTARSDQHRCRAFKEHSFMHSQGQHNWARIATQNQRSDRQTVRPSSLSFKSYRKAVRVHAHNCGTWTLVLLNEVVWASARRMASALNSNCHRFQESSYGSDGFNIEGETMNAASLNIFKQPSWAALSPFTQMTAYCSTLALRAIYNSAQVSFNIFQSFTWRKRSVPSLVYKPIGNKETKSKDEAVVPTTKLGMIAWLKPYRIVAQQIRLNPRNKASLKSMTFVSKDTRDTEEAKD